MSKNSTGWQTVVGNLPKGLKLAFRRGAVYRSLVRPMEETAKLGEAELAKTKKDVQHGS